MYYELYIDVLFLENFMLDSLLLLLTGRILKCGCSYGRIILGGALGSAMTCVIVMLPMPGIIELILYHTVVNSAMIIAGLGIKSLPQFAKAFVLLYVCAVFFGGIMQLFRPYMRYASLFYAAAALSCLLFMKLWRAVSRLRDCEDHIVRVTIYTGKGRIEVKALVDTGNRLRDFLTGEPVSVLSQKAALEVSELPERENGFRMIPYQCVSGESVMKVFRIRKMCIHMKEERWIENPLLGIGEEWGSCDEEYEMILNPAILSE